MATKSVFTNPIAIAANAYGKMPQETPSNPIKALLFDLMGTCTNWEPGIIHALGTAPPLDALPPHQFPQFASDWRARFFQETADRYDAGQPTEDIDITHRRALNYLLLQLNITPKHWDDGVRNMLVQSWHSQEGVGGSLDLWKIAEAA